MTTATIWTTPNNWFTGQALVILDFRKVEYTVKNVLEPENKTAFLAAYPGINHFPQIELDGKKIGGYQALYEWTMKILRDDQAAAKAAAELAKSPEGIAAAKAAAEAANLEAKNR